MVLLSLQKDSGEVKGSKRPETQWLKECEAKGHTNLDQIDKRWDQNDHYVNISVLIKLLCIFLIRSYILSSNKCGFENKMWTDLQFDRNKFTGTDMQIRQEFNALCPG